MERICKEQYKLAIVILTMNRKKKVCKAIQSCLNCVIPYSYQFIVVDNGSTDGTEEVVKKLLDENKQDYIYRYLSENIGVGPGREIGFSSANAEYLYFLDDDAVIAPDSYSTFFVRSINTFEKYSEVATITTLIYDEALHHNRVVASSKKNNSNSELHEIMMYLGGSHFLRKEAMRLPLYMPIKYGYEELMPSFYVIQKGMKNIYMESIGILHQPEINKWKEGTDQAKEFRRKDCYIPKAIKSVLYPKVCAPVLYVFFLLRVIRNVGFTYQEISRCSKLQKELCDYLRCEEYPKIKIKTVIQLLNKFGAAAI